MNINLYFDLVIWLKKKEMRRDIDEWSKSIINTTHKQYEIQGSQLYWKKANNIISVIREGNMNNIIKLAHKSSTGRIHGTTQYILQTSRSCVVARNAGRHHQLC